MTRAAHPVGRRPSERMGAWGTEAKALSWLLGGDVLTRVVGQVAVVLTARLLGRTEYGALATALAIFSVTTVLSDVGVGDSAVQTLTRQPGGEERFWREVAPLRVAASLLLLPVGLGFTALVSTPSIRAAGLLLAGVPLASLVTNRVISARISEAFGGAARWAALLGLCQSVGALCAAAAYAKTGVTAAAGIAVALCAAAALAARKARWHAPGRQAMSLWLRRGVPFSITAVAVALYSRADRIVVAAIRGSATAGDYVAAYNVVMLAAIAGAALHAAVLPRLLDEYRQGEAPRWPGRAAIVSALALPFMVLLGLFSSSIMTTLYGQTYSSAGSILRVLSPLAVLYIVNPFLASSLIAAGHQRALAQIAVLNAVVAVVSYPLATSSFGARGAAAASVGAEILSTVLVVRALRRPAAAPDAADAFGGVVS